MSSEWLDVLDPGVQRELLLGIISLSAATDDLPALARGAAGLAARLSDADRCLIHVLDDDRRRLILTGTWPSGDTAGAWPTGDKAGAEPVDAAAAADVDDAEVLRIGSGLIGWVASHGRPAVSADVNSDVRGAEVPAGRPSPYASAVSAPIGRPGTAPCGVVSVFTRAPRDFTDEQVECIVGIGRLLAPSLAAARHHQQLHARELSRHRSTEDFISLQESERRRLAADVHDGVGQRIVGLSFHLIAAAESLADRPDFAAEQLATARELADLAQAEVRSAVYGLRPPLLDDLGLADALASLGRRAPGLDVDVRVTEQPLEDHVATSLYRITQEALQNVTKHADAGRAIVELFMSGRHVILRITDDGDGFDPGDHTDGHGLTIMRERAELIGGRLDLISRRGGGTTISVRLPLSAQHPHPPPR